MLNSMRNNSTLIMLAIICLAIAAFCQLLIPSLIARELSNIVNGDNNLEFLIIFSLAFLCKIAAQGSGNCLASYIESDTRFFLISIIVHNVKPMTIASRITLIKEDAERVASAVHELIHLAGSCILTFAAAYLLLNENLYFSIPLIIIAAFTSRHIKTATTKIQNIYTKEIENEELYKASILKSLNLIISRPKYSHACLNENFRLLDEATHARYQYNKASLILSFWPELTIAFSSVFVIMLGATLSTELFGVQLIAYLGYIGIFTMASANSVRLAISLIGVNVSVRRIFNGA